MGKLKPLKTNIEASEKIVPGIILNNEASEEILTTEKKKWVMQQYSSGFFADVRYYIAMNNEYPSHTCYANQDIEAVYLLKLLKENMGAKVVYSYNTVYKTNERMMTRYTVGFPNSRYLLHATQIQEFREYYEPSDFMLKDVDFDGHVYTSQLDFHHPAEDSEFRDMDLEKKFKYYLDYCTLKKKSKRPEIYMIESSDGNFSLQSHTVNEDFEIKDLDLNYGNGFSKFHDELMKRFMNETKGLILFHGEPGTGKTYYIRHLLRKMAVNKKLVIYMPPNMVDYLIQPGFMSFLSDEVNQWARSGYFCVLLIEDAEPLLAARHSETRIQGVTNLLNITDGLLNDILRMQIICTFNVPLKKLDKALLRPGRLLARKEFKPLSQLDANILASRLGIKHNFKSSSSLAQIYSFLKNKNTLIHDVE